MRVVLAELPALLLQKLLKFLLANGLGQRGRPGLDRGVSLLGAALFEAEAIMDLEVFSLDGPADGPIDDFVPAVDQFGLDEGLAVELAGEEVLEVAVHQSFVAQLLALQRLHPEFPSPLHIRTIIIICLPANPQHTVQVWASMVFGKRGGSYFSVYNGVAAMEKLRNKI